MRFYLIYNFFRKNDAFLGYKCDLAIVLIILQLSCKHLKTNLSSKFNYFPFLLFILKITYIPPIKHNTYANSLKCPTTQETEHSQHPRHRITVLGLCPIVSYSLSCLLRCSFPQFAISFCHSPMYLRSQMITNDLKLLPLKGGFYALSAQV